MTETAGGLFSLEKPALSGELSFQQKTGYYPIERRRTGAVGLQPNHEFLEPLGFDSRRPPK
jgi:hypothetical protein